MDLLITCKPDYEKLLARELTLYGLKACGEGRGWVRSQAQTEINEACFACTIRENPVEIEAASVNAFTEKLIGLFINSIKDKQIDSPWQFLFSSCDDKRLIGRAKTVENDWRKKIRKKMSRVAKLSSSGIPYSPVFIPGFFVHFIDFNVCLVSFKALSLGQKRMQMDPQAPSRSYLKIEEAFNLIGYEPKKNETVVDLGAAPGGWSYSALRRGAKVIAIDNGRLKEPLESHPNIRHLKEDALEFDPVGMKPVDWLFCDIIERPEVIFNLMHKWLARKWCRNFAVNLKVGRADPILLLKKIKDPKKGLSAYCRLLKIRQLYHDRQEITLVGKIA
ncbi:SAM-dependent methyltransferase [Candidatus Omnitrophota bacterium]